MPTETQIFDQVKNALVQALGVDEEEVVPSAILTKDLGAESIDFLDIIFRLEKAFGIKIPKDEFFPHNFATNKAFLADGKLTQEGLAELINRYPFLDVKAIEQKMDSFDMQDLFTVSMLVGYIQARLANSN